MMTWVSALLCAATVGALATEVEKPQKVFKEFVKGKGKVYHTTDELYAELEALESRCPAMSIKKVSTPTFFEAMDLLRENDHKRTPLEEEDHELWLVTIHDKQPDEGSPERRVLVNANAHGREHVTGELALHLSKSLCGEGPEGTKGKTLLRKGVAFQILPVASPSSRILAETDTCRRLSGHGEDINRNHDFMWQMGPTDQNLETFKGESPSSAPETSTVEWIAQRFRPHMFIDLHTGTMKMMTPWGYTTEVPSKQNQIDKLQQSLEKINKKVKVLPDNSIGRRSLMQDSVIFGSAADYMFQKGWSGPTAKADQEQGVPYSVTLEIFGRMGNKESNSHPMLAQWFKDQPMDALYSAADMEKIDAHNADLERDDETCFYSFNPSSKGKVFDKVMTKWSKVIMDLASDLNEGLLPVSKD